jgi:predicted nucleotidyltransferase
MVLINADLSIAKDSRMHDKLLTKVKNAVLSIEPIAQVILFGSRARNDFQENSDWDFLVLVDGEVSTLRADTIRHSLYEIEWETGEVISTIVKSRQLWNNPDYRVVPLHKSIEREGKML